MIKVMAFFRYIAGFGMGYLLCSAIYSAWFHEVNKEQGYSAMCVMLLLFICTVECYYQDSM